MDTSRWTLRRRRIGACLTALLSLVGAAPQEDEAGPENGNPRYRALIVGVGNYPATSGWTLLEGAPRDAEQIACLLQDRFGFQPDDVLLLTNEDATREAILSAFRHHLIEGVGPNTLAVFYFAGHGSQLWDSNGDEGEGDDGLDETLCPYDSQKEDGERQDIRDDLLGELFRELNSKAGQVVGLFDSCHSGTAMRGGQDTVRVRRAPAQPRDGVRPDRSATRSGGKDELRVLLDSPWPGRTQPVFLMACQDDQNALESGTPDRRGHFTKALESTLRRVRPHDTWGIVYQQVLAHMYRNRREQHPRLHGPPDRLVFADGFEPAAVDFVVLDSFIREQVGYARIGGGRFDGIEPGCRLELAPQKSHLRPLSAVVQTAELSECVAVLDQVVRPPLAIQIPGHYRAEFLEGPAPEFQSRLALPDSLPEEGGLTQLTRWREDSHRYRPPDEAGFDLIVTFDAEVGFVVTTAAGRRVLPHPFRPTHTVRLLTLDLDVFAVRESVRAIQNPESPLAGDVRVVTVLGWAPPTIDEQSFEERPELWSIGRYGEPLARFDDFVRAVGEDEPPRVPAIQIKFHNDSTRDLFVGGYNLLPNWGVDPIPKEFELPAGKRRTRIMRLNERGWSWQGQFVPGLPPESYKFFFTEESRDYSRVGTAGIVNPEDQVGPRNSQVRGGAPGRRSSLDELLRFAQDGGGMRGTTRPKRPMHWTTQSIEVSIVPRTLPKSPPPEDEGG